MVQVKGRWALITGASRGIGNLTAKFMAEQGCSLILHSRKKEHCEELLRQLLVIGINQKIAIQWDFPITYEMARAYQKANGKYLRQNQWEDITLVMSLELGK